MKKLRFHGLVSRPDRQVLLPAPGKSQERLMALAWVQLGEAPRGAERHPPRITVLPALSLRGGSRG